MTQINFDIHKDEHYLENEMDLWLSTQDISNEKPNFKTKESMKEYILKAAVLVGFGRQWYDYELLGEKLKEDVDTDIFYTLLNNTTGPENPPQHYLEYMRQNEKEITESLGFEVIEGVSFEEREAEFTNAISELTKELNFDSLFYEEALAILDDWSEIALHINARLIGKDLSQEDLVLFTDIYPVAVSLTQHFTLEYAMENGFDLHLVALHNSKLNSEEREKFMTTHNLKSLFN